MHLANAGFKLLLYWWTDLPAMSLFQGGYYTELNAKTSPGRYPGANGANVCIFWQQHTDFLTVALLKRRRKKEVHSLVQASPLAETGLQAKHIKMHWSKVMLLEAGCAPKLCSWDYIPRQQGAWLRAILPGSERMKASVSTAIKSMHGWLLPGWLEAAVTSVWTWCWWGISPNGFPTDPWLQGSVQLHGAEKRGHRSDVSACSQLMTLVEL